MCLDADMIPVNRVLPTYEAMEWGARTCQLSVCLLLRASLLLACKRKHWQQLRLDLGHPHNFGTVCIAQSIV